MTAQKQTLTEKSVTIRMRANIVILTAEDDEGHYLLIKHCLRGAGISNEILWFKNGMDTLEFLSGEEFEREEKKYILLLDIRMPRVDGIEVLKEMKADETLAHIPVIMLTTSEDQELASRCYDLGCEAHIVKPPGPVLLKAIKRVCLQL